MSYIAIRRDAVDELIADRRLQSADFAEAAALSMSLRSFTQIAISPRICSEKVGDGLFFFGQYPATYHYVIIDIDESKLLEFSDAHLILFLQKSLRFAAKYWDKAILSQTERVLTGFKAIVFPFPISQQTKVRISIDLKPDSERLMKRKRAGRYILLYKIGTDEGEGLAERASLANFRRFLEVIPSFEAGSHRAIAVQPENETVSSLSSTSLAILPSKIDIHQTYDVWLQLLTDDQKKFVCSTLTHPSRIDGPAGTGKTTTLALAAVHALKLAKDEGREFQGIFFTHSEATKHNIITVLSAMGGGEFLTNQSSFHRLRVETLQGYCASILQQAISATEFVDPDAYDAKQLQSMYVEEALSQVEKDLDTYLRFISSDLKEYLESEELSTKSTLIQHEISVVIKGRAQEDFDTYKKIPAIMAGLPINNEADKGFFWRVYERYREQLVSGGQFDTDDVVLSALGQLSTPIWRRRRARDGFDAIYIDETHLFNMNELSIFHNLTRSEHSFPLAFAVDRSQAIGDRGWADDIDVVSLMPATNDQGDGTSVKLNAIFRSSADIVNLAFTITSSGASLFTNFQDPLKLAHSNMTHDEEKRALSPVYVSFPTDDEMVSGAFILAEKMRAEMASSRGDVAVIVFSNELFRTLEKYGDEQNKPMEVLKRRGDVDLVNQAKSNGKFVLSLADYVGGLEFDGVILVGVDGGRVPPVSLSQHSQSKAYMTFASHNRLYVAVTRARYRVQILGVEDRGPSQILEAAFANKTIDALKYRDL